MKDLKKTLYLGLGLGVKLIAGLFAVKLCAQLLGPEAFGVTGQLGSLLSVVSLLAGAGVSVGMTKVYAGAEFPPESRPDWIRAARWIALGSAGLLSVLFLLASGWVSEQLFNGNEHSHWLLERPGAGHPARRLRPASARARSMARTGMTSMPCRSHWAARSGCSGSGGWGATWGRPVPCWE